MDLRGKKLFGTKRKDQENAGKDNVNEMFDTYEERYRSLIISNNISIGVDYISGDATSRAFLVNAKSYKYKPEDSPQEWACLLMYFVDESGKWFKGIYTYEPYFFIKCKQEVAKYF